MKDAAVILWRLNDTPPSANLLQDDEEENRESWTAFKVLRFVSSRNCCQIENFCILWFVRLLISCNGCF